MAEEAVPLESARPVYPTVNTIVVAVDAVVVLSEPGHQQLLYIDLIIQEYSHFSNRSVK